MGTIIKAVSIAFILIAYPFLSSYLAGLGFANLELLVFAALTLWRGLNSKTMALRFGSFLFAALLLTGAYFTNAYFIWLVPSLAYLWLTVLFGHTLWTPSSLCERLVRLQYPEFIPGIAEYLREVTWAWTLFFAINVPVCALLPALAGQKVWAVYTGVLVYVLMGLLGVGEWFYRHRRFPDLEIPPMLETFTFMARHGHKVFKG
ncbi:MAG: hypothetical protein Q8L15_20790 [Methylobacter sp.]|nr:hypothetical protein [Methylobacter sp.]